MIVVLFFINFFVCVMLVFSIGCTSLPIALRVIVVEYYTQKKIPSGISSIILHHYMLLDFLIHNMAVKNLCNVCNRKVLRHSYHRSCTSCKSLVHIKCVPQVNKTDSIYTLRNQDNWYCTKCSAEIPVWVRGTRCRIGPQFHSCLWQESD